MRLFLLALVLPACFDKSVDDEGPHCEDTVTVVALDEVTPLGLSAADVLAQVPTEEATVLRYADDVLTDLTLGFAPGAQARFVDSEAVYPEGGVMIDIAVICDDRLEIDGTFTFATADLAFDEAFDSVLVATEQSIGITQDLDLDGLRGSFDIAPYVEAEGYDELSAWIYADFDDGVSVGSIEGQASGEDECEAGDECTAWAAAVDVGSWPAE